MRFSSLIVIGVTVALVWSTTCALSLYFNKESSVSLSYANAAKLSKLSITESIAAFNFFIAASVEAVVAAAAALSFTYFVIASLAAAYTASPAAHAAPINGFSWFAAIGLLLYVFKCVWICGFNSCGFAPKLMLLNSNNKIAFADRPFTLFVINALVAMATAQMMECDLVGVDAPIAAFMQSLNAVPVAAAAAAAASVIAFFSSSVIFAFGVKWHGYL